jgi:two-component system KDP operon response regulator KdpE
VAELRARTEAPIIVVSSRGDELDKVAVLDAGADDYVIKPFGVDELLARLRAVLRRITARDPDDDNDTPIATADFTIHLADRRLVGTDGREIHLTRVEWRMVEVLAQRAGHLVPHEKLLVAVWGPKGLEKPGNVRVNMAHIRAKVEPEPTHPRYFVTAPGLGVRFDPRGGER